METTIQLDQEPAIMVREPDATMQPTPQDYQLMSKQSVLSFKPQLRLEWRGQDGQNETEQPDHSASLGDSITASTRIRFLVHTGRGIFRPQQPSRAGSRRTPSKPCPWRRLQPEIRHRSRDRRDAEARAWRPFR